jgi:Flp pilus assembly pilin Flp
MVRSDMGNTDMIRSLFASTAAAVADRKGVTAAEYAILAVAIVGAVAAGASYLDTGLKSAFTGLQTKLTTTTTTTP